MSDLVLWLFTYLVHSSAILLVALVVERTPLLRREGAKEWAWRAALLCPLASASLQVGLDWVPWTGTATLPFELEAALPEPPRAAQPGFAFPSEPAASTLDSAASSASASNLHPVGGLLTVLGLLFLGLGVIQRLRVRAALGSRRPLVDPAWSADLKSLRSVGGFRRRVRLTVSSRIESPMALGLITPEICVPARAVGGLEPDLRRAVLAHELAHHKRLDPFWLEVSGGIQRLFLFQAGNRFAHRRLNELSELGADALASRWTGDRFAVARSLTEVAGWLVHERLPAGTCAMVVRRSGLELRVRALLDRARSRFELEAGPSVRIGVLTAAVLMPFALPGWSGAIVEREAPHTWLGAAQRVDDLQGKLAQLEAALGASPGAAVDQLRWRANALSLELEGLGAIVHASSSVPSVPPSHPSLQNR